MIYDIKLGNRIYFTFSMQKNCRQCTQKLEVTDEDLKFYDKISPVFGGRKFPIPIPTLCPSCRQQRRLVFRNERKLYHRKCDLTGKEIISMYSPDKKIKVYDREVWWSDRWNPLDYGKNFDFSRPFFEQFKELLIAVPRIALNNKDPYNSEYCNFALENRDCYLTFTSGLEESCFYTNRSFRNKNCSDCTTTEDSELCYEMIDSIHCYHSSWLQNCTNSSDCFFGYNLKGCSYCFGCANLTQKKYHIFNQPYSEEEYKKRLQELWKNLPAARKEFEKMKLKAIRKNINGMQLENCSGDALFNSKNAQDCYEGNHLQDCRYVTNTTNMKDSYDVDNDDNSELVYECVGSETNYQHLFNDICWFNTDDYYNSLCFNSKNIFGCVGLKKNQYCILNKQYSKEEYEQLVPRIIEHMMKNGEWGEFFPMALSTFAYNETPAQDYYPLTREQAAQLGATWEDYKETSGYQGVKIQVPDDISKVNDTITKEILHCEQCGKNYKIILQELQFYRKLLLPLPKKCPECRYKGRLELRNPRTLWTRSCAKCGTDMQTTYAPDRPETVYCESCYLKEIY